jgi:hypothetical protein
MILWVLASFLAYTLWEDKMIRRLLIKIVIVQSVVAVFGSLEAAELTVDERAAGIAAVETLRHSHRLGVDASDFARDYPREMWRSRSQMFGDLLDAARSRHGVTEVGAALDRELSRMRARTRDSNRLAAMMEVLGHNPARLRECLALPGVAHMLDELVSGDFKHSAVDGPTSEEWEWWVSPAVFDGRQWHTAVWTGNEMIVWGGWDGDYLATGGLYEPATDTWLPTSAVDAPLGRGSHSAVWADGLMIVWGGYGDGEYFGDGGRLDPAINAWISMTTVDAPDGRAYHTAVWTGHRMFVWGGGDDVGALGTGGLYEPVSDEWMNVTMTDAPISRYDHVMVWTGTEAILWGGATYYSLPPGTTNSGARYDPIGDHWTAIETTGAPSGRFAHSGVWSGTEMIVWGGGSYDNTGGRYDPATDSWLATNENDAPEGRAYSPAVWTGEKMIVWGGSVVNGPESDTGGHYDPVSDSWAPTNLIGVPEPSFGHTAVWTGDEMLIWGGQFTNELAGYADRRLVFRDGFESGDISEWSLVHPE